MRNIRVTYIIAILLFSTSLCTISDAHSDSKPKVTVSVSTGQPATEPDHVEPQQLPEQQLPQHRRPITQHNLPPPGALESVLNHISGCKPVAEICNRKDDDCDGVIDNNIRSQSCTPSTQLQDGCFTAHTSCINGQTVCDVDSSHSVEVCNDLDDDCDGIVDNRIPSKSCFINLNQGYGSTVCRRGNTYCRPNVQRPIYSDCNNTNGDCYLDSDNRNSAGNTDNPPTENDIEYAQGKNPATVSNTEIHEGDDCSKANFIEPGKFPIDLDGYKDDITLSCGTHSSADRFYQLSLDAGKLNITFNEKDSDAVWALYEGSCGSMHEVFCGKGTTPPLKSNVYYLVVEVPPNSATPRSVMHIKYTP